MSNLLGGIHDREGRAVVPAGGWCLDTIALSENPKPTNYRRLKADIHWIVRANWGYGRGTIPQPDQYEEMARRLAKYVAQSPGCMRWIVGNEPNLSHEWPGPEGSPQPIHPIHYAECYLDCRHAIKATPGHEHDEVLIAAPGPWNAELKYAGNERGDWVKYFEDVQEIVGASCDGFAIHAYTHGCDPALVTSEARMDAPFADRHYQFRVYQDFVNAIRPELRHLPLYLTEANGNGPWRAAGLIPAILEEISNWNASGQQGFRCVVFYRYPKYDQFFMEGKADVIAEFVAAMHRDYSASNESAANSQASQNFMPAISTGPAPIAPPAPQPVREIDARATARGVNIGTPANLQPGQKYWFVRSIRWYDEKESQGRHHIYVEALDADGKPISAPFSVSWPNGSAGGQTNGRSGFDAGNFPMSKSLNEFSVVMAGGGYPSERVTGIGMGADGNSGIHTSTSVVFQLATMPQPAQQPSQPIPSVQPQQPAQIPAPAHPVADPRYRVVTQPFGSTAEDYSRFGLAGHNGIDFGVPNGQGIVAADNGYVAESQSDPAGYGEYVKLIHPWGETLYAHLSKRIVQAGEGVNKGQFIGKSGYSGNVDPPGPGGAHLHFGLRVNPYTRGYPYDGYSDPAPYLINVAPAPVQASSDLIAITKAAASEFGVDWRLLAGLIMAESSYNSQSVNKQSGAKGLGNIMPATWTEWAATVGAKDILNPTDNARVAAAYLAWCVKQTKDSVYLGLVAYVWGIGNVLQGNEPPQEASDYASRVMYGRDLLEKVGCL